MTLKFGDVEVFFRRVAIGNGDECQKAESEENDLKQKNNLLINCTARKKAIV